MRRDLIDFGDQMVLGARLAEERPEVGAIEREKFRVVLLDEYQDTSVAQRRMLVGLVRRLRATRAHGAGHPVTAVGDPCQSIYGWRGASVANLDDFPDHFAKLDGTRSRGYALSENRRSGGHLLEFANVVSDPLRQRHTGVRQLRPSEEKADKGWTRVGLTETAEDEVKWVARMVADAHYRGGIALREIAVLVRKGNQIPPLYEEMHAQGLPVEVVGLSGLVHLPEVADLIAMLDVLDEPIANASLVRLLTGPRWRIGARDLALLGMRARELVRDPAETALIYGGSAAGDRAGRDRLAEAVAGSDPTEVVSLSDAMADPGSDLPFSEEARVRFARFASEVRILRRRLSEPVLDVLHRVISVTGLDVEVAASPKLVAQRSAETLAAFLGRAADFQDLEGDQSVTAFRAYLKAAERHERGIDASLPSQGDSVKLLTMHKSKGLEWDAVFVPHLAGAAQKPRESWIGSGAVLPYPLRGDAEHLPVLDDTGNTAAFKSFKEQAKEYESWEDLRLEYVTVTRPRYYLTASGHWWGPTQKRRRGPDTWLTGLYEHCQDGHGEIVAWAAEPDPDAVNPSIGAIEARWPVLPDAEAGERRRIGAEMVIAALHRRQAEAFGEPIDVRSDSEEPQAAEQPDDGVVAVLVLVLVPVPVMRWPRGTLAHRRPCSTRPASRSPTSCPPSGPPRNRPSRTSSTPSTSPPPRTARPSLPGTATSKPCWRSSSAATPSSATRRSRPRCRPPSCCATAMTPRASAASWRVRCRSRRRRRPGWAPSSTPGSSRCSGSRPCSSTRTCPAPPTRTSTTRST